MIKKLAVFMIAASLALSPSVMAAKPDKPGGGTPPAGSTAYVCLDPGHGGSDPGAIYGNVTEAELNLSVAKKVQTLLAADSIESQLTRTDNSTKDNNDRYTFCNSTPATALVSIHHNSSADTSIDYTMAMYHQSSSKKLAEVVGRAVAGGVGNGLDSFRVTRYPSGVLIKSNMPSMMSEGYFGSNAARTAELNNETQRATLEQREAEAIFSGLKAYFGL